MVKRWISQNLEKPGCTTSKSEHGATQEKGNNVRLNTRDHRYCEILQYSLIFLVIIKVKLTLREILDTPVGDGRWFPRLGILGKEKNYINRIGIVALSGQ